MRMVARHPELIADQEYDNLFTGQPLFDSEDWRLIAKDGVGW